MLKPTRKDIYEKLINPKLKNVIDANTQWFYLWTEWVGERFVKVKGGWIDRLADSTNRPLYSTQELKEKYEALTGTKAPKFEPANR